MTKLVVNGICEGVYIVPIEGDSIESSPVVEGEVSLEGFKGDRHAGFTLLSGSRTPFYPRGTVIRNSRQVSLVSTEELSLIARDIGLPQLQPEWLGANLLISGIPRFTQIPPGTRFFFPQGAVLLAQGENNPCRLAGDAVQSHFPDDAELSQRFIASAKHRRGLVACVEHPGIVRPGEAVRLEIPSQVLYEVG